MIGRLAVLAGVIALAGCGAGASATPPVQRSPSPPARLAAGAPAHVALIVMENEEYGDVIGSRSAPYINRLARSYSLANGMYAIGHPRCPTTWR